MLGVTTHPHHKKETAVLSTLPRPGSGLQTVPGTGPVLPCVPAGAPDPAVFADAVARYRALERLRGFRQSLYECLDARADALFELADAVLCADHAVTSNRSSLADSVPHPNNSAATMARSETLTVSHPCSAHR